MESIQQTQARGVPTVPALDRERRAGQEFRARFSPWRVPGHLGYLVLSLTKKQNQENKKLRIKAS